MAELYIYESGKHFVAVHWDRKETKHASYKEARRAAVKRAEAAGLAGYNLYHGKP